MAIQRKEKLTIFNAPLSAIKIPMIFPSKFSYSGKVKYISCWFLENWLALFDGFFLFSILGHQLEVCEVIASSCSLVCFYLSEALLCPFSCFFVPLHYCKLLPKVIWKSSWEVFSSAGDVLSARTRVIVFNFA